MKIGDTHMFVGFYETFYPSDSYYFIEETQESNGIYLFLADTGEKEGRVYERFFIYADDAVLRGGIRVYEKCGKGG